MENKTEEAGLGTERAYGQHFPIKFYCHGCGVFVSKGIPQWGALAVFCASCYEIYKSKLPKISDFPIVV